MRLFTARRAIGALLLLVLIVGAGNLLATFWDVRDNNMAQKQQGLLVERKLCTTLGKLAAEKPPPGNPRTNPSRAYLQELHATFEDLGRDIGCGIYGR